VCLDAYDAQLDQFRGLPSSVKSPKLWNFNLAFTDWVESSSAAMLLVAEDNCEEEPACQPVECDADESWSEDLCQCIIVGNEDESPCKPHLDPGANPAYDGANVECALMQLKNILESFEIDYQATQAGLDGAVYVSIQKLSPEEAQKAYKQPLADADPAPPVPDEEDPDQEEVWFVPVAAVKPGSTNPYIKNCRVYLKSPVTWSLISQYIDTLALLPSAGFVHKGEAYSIQTWAENHYIEV